MIYFQEEVKDKKGEKRLRVVSLGVDAVSSVNHQKWLEKELKAEGFAPLGAVLAVAWHNKNMGVPVLTLPDGTA